MRSAWIIAACNLYPRIFDFDNPEWMVNNIAQSNQIELDESAS
jgi:hypothetical protein